MQGLRFCISVQLPGDVSAASLGTTLSKRDESQLWGTCYTL